MSGDRLQLHEPSDNGNVGDAGDTTIIDADFALIRRLQALLDEAASETRVRVLHYLTEYYEGIEFRVQQEGSMRHLAETVGDMISDVLDGRDGADDGEGWKHGPKEHV